MVGKQKYGIKYTRNDNQGLLAFTDADFAGCKQTSKSTSGRLIVYAGGPVAWRSQRQKLVTLSTTEAEFVSLCSTVKDLVCLRALALELKIIERLPTPVFCDNSSAIFIAKEEKAAHRTRHLGAQIKYPKEQSIKGEVIIKKIAAFDQLADLLTKPVAKTKFNSYLSHLMLHSH